MTLLGRSYLERFGNPLAAYNRLQTALMKHFFRRGGSPEIWLERMAPAFRKRHGWICDGLQAIPVRARNQERR